MVTNACGKGAGMFPTRFLTVSGLILAAALARLVPHPPNFTPIAAMALLGGACFADRRLAFVVPLAAMFLSDLVLGFSAVTPVIYGCFAAIVGIGFLLRNRRGVVRIAAASLTASLLFFVVTNYAVWQLYDYYPKTLAGLIECYVAALPFFGYSLAGDAAWVTMLFGGMALMEKAVPGVRKRPAGIVPS
jgi:hypothetical protein